MNAGKPLIITMGEPAGVGPDTVIKAWRELHRRIENPFVLLGDINVIQARSNALGNLAPIASVEALEAAAAIFRSALPVLHRPLQTLPKPGQIASENATIVARLIEEAATLALQRQCAGIVTCPIQKETLYAAGFTFEGHTDFLAELAKRAGYSAVPVMMLVAGNLRTIPVTVHIPLKDVAKVLSIQSIVEQARVAAKDLKGRFGIANPRVGMTGLNPHAGEGGTIGTEEKTIIGPAIAQLISEGLNVKGPLPADTAFHEEARAEFDVIICMYHDQALIPVKTLDFHGGVNVTLGLPFIRTSPDHGTALSLAGKGSANPRSLISAIELALELAGRDHP